MWERYRDGFGLPITIVSIIVILFDQGYARSSVLALIVGVQIFRMARDGWFLSSREKEYYEEQRRIEQIELERIREWEEGIFYLHNQWASPVRKKLENDVLWREAVYRTYTHSTTQKLTEDQIYKRVRELLPQLVVDAPEHWSEKRIVVPPQFFYHDLGYTDWEWFGLELWGYIGDGEEEEFCEGENFDSLRHWDWDTAPPHPFSLDQAMKEFISIRKHSEHLYPYLSGVNLQYPDAILRKETLDRLSSEFPVRPTKQRRRAIPRDVQDRVWRRDNGKCAGCGSNKNLEFDHIIPFSKGGANTYRNLQLLCQKCNRSKSDKIGG